MSDFGCDPWNWRIASTEPGLATGAFYLWRLPPPTVVNFVDHSEQKPRSDGSLAFHGRQSVNYMWDILDANQMGQLKRLVSLSGDAIYLTLDKGIGDTFGRDWVDVRGIPHLPTVSQGGPLDYVTGRPHYKNVQFFVNEVTILNDPSIYAE
jgi:hypothetical protein